MLEHWSEMQWMQEHWSGMAWLRDHPGVTGGSGMMGSMPMAGSLGVDAGSLELDVLVDGIPLGGHAVDPRPLEHVAMIRWLRGRPA